MSQVVLRLTTEDSPGKNDCQGEFLWPQVVLHAAPAIFQVEQPLRSKKCVWQKLLSKQRKRAVVACFRMAPLYNLPRYVLGTV